MSSYANLLAPGHIGSLAVPNRIVMPPLGLRMAHPDGSVSGREIAFYVARARGGAGLLMTGAMLAATDVEPPRAAMTRADDDRFLPGLRSLVTAVHGAGSRIAAQLSPGLGRVGAPEPGRSVPISASASPWPQNPGASCRALETEDVRLLVHRFGEAAARMAAAGFDAIDVHGHSGHLVDQFLTTVWNHRTDVYGGSLENRCRFAVELVEAARAAAPGLPISFRLTTVHHVDGGRELAESLEIATVLQDAGVDLMIVDEGAHEAADWAFPSYYLGDAPYLAGATAVSRALRIPVMVAGNMTPGIAEKALADGDIAFVGMGRALVADPDLPRKLLADRPGRIRPCTRCNAMCIGHVAVGAALGCSVNPQAGFETSRVIGRAARAKRVVVVGAGPAGLEAARVAALRGHSVDLYERSDHLGGVLWSAAAPEFKRELRAMVAWWKGQLAAQMVAVHLNREITPGSPVLAAAQEIVLATGGLPVHPLSVTGMRRHDVVEVLDLHRGAPVGQRVLVAGGGLSGADAALQLALDGHVVTIVEQEESIARDTLQLNRKALLRRLAGAGVTVLTGHTVRAIDEDGVLVHSADGTRRLTADTVVTAFGLRPNSSLAGPGVLEDPRVHVIGDCVEPAKVGDAVHAGFLAAMAI